MHKSIDYYLPKWICDRVSQRICSCGNHFSKKDVVQLGVRKGKTKNSPESVAAELYCSKCERGIVITFPYDCDFRQMVCSLLKEIQKKDDLEKSVEQERTNFGSKISDEEVKDFKKKLNSINNYDDLLKELGIDMDESNETK